MNSVSAYSAKSQQQGAFYCNIQTLQLIWMNDGKIVTFIMCVCQGFLVILTHIESDYIFNCWK